MTAVNWNISNLENGSWSVQAGPTINPVSPASFLTELVASGLLVSCSGPAYAGALAKLTMPLVLPSTRISFRYNLQFDDSIQYGQVVETDIKITDAAGNTYDGSFQFNIAEGWMTQINNPWVDTGFKAALNQYVPNAVDIEYEINYTAKTLTVLSVNGTPITMAPIPAKQLGWTPNQIVVQLQLCTSSNGGEYSARFSGISLSGNQ